MVDEHSPFACWSLIRNRPYAATFLMGFALIFGSAASRTTIDLIDSIAPRDSYIRSTVITDLPGGFHRGQLVVESPESPRCYRFRSDYAFRNLPGKRPEFNQLESSFNGNGLNKAGTFDIDVVIPPYVNSTWSLSFRLLYLCPIWPLGMLTHSVPGPVVPLNLLMTSDP